jgi:hypothetical protein
MLFAAILNLRFPAICHASQKITAIIAIMAVKAFVSKKMTRCMVLDYNECMEQHPHSSTYS